MSVDERLGLLTYKNDHESHISIMNSDVCVSQCKDKPCTVLCPADVYSWIPKEAPAALIPQSPAPSPQPPAPSPQRSASGSIKVQHENCIECGGCRVICPYLNIDCHWPRGGFGVAYKFG